MIDTAAPDSAEPRAFLRIGGVSLARQQLGTALALGSDRIICVARALSRDLVELQHLAEKAGAQFHLVSGPRQLAGLITATDDVIVLADGLLAPASSLRELLEKGPGVLVQPIEVGLAAGFERIDLNHASAGALRIPGRLVERLGELPADCDAASALQRIALQAGIPQRALPATGANAGLWTLVRSENEAHDLEPRWIRQRISGEQPRSPSRYLATLAVRAGGPAVLHAGSGSFAVIILALFIAMIGLVAGWFGYAVVGLLLCALGWIVRQAAALLTRIERDALGLPAPQYAPEAAYGWLLDVALVVLAAWGASVHAWQPHHDRFFPPFMLLALMRLLPGVLPRRWTHWLEDRGLLAVFLAGAVASGFGSVTFHVGAVVLALVGIVLSRDGIRITRP